VLFVDWAWICGISVSVTRYRSRAFQEAKTANRIEKLRNIRDDPLSLADDGLPAAGSFVPAHRLQRAVIGKLGRSARRYSRNAGAFSPASPMLPALLSLLNPRPGKKSRSVRFWRRSINFLKDTVSSSYRRHPLVAVARACRCSISFVRFPNTDQPAQSKSRVELPTFSI